MFFRCVLLEAWVRLGRFREESAGMRRQRREASDAQVVSVTVLGLVSGAPSQGWDASGLLVSYSGASYSQRPEQAERQ